MRAQDAANVYGNTHMTDERWSLRRGRHTVCLECGQTPRDRRDGREPVCDASFLARLLKEVPRQLYVSMPTEQHPVTPVVPVQWRRR